MSRFAQYEDKILIFKCNTNIIIVTNIVNIIINQFAIETLLVVRTYGWMLYENFETMQSHIKQFTNSMQWLLLQKPSKNSKSKDHSVSLARRLKLWEERNISNLLHEGETIEERMKISEKGMYIEKTSLKFKNMISKGNVNGALKLLT